MTAETLMADIAAYCNADPPQPVPPALRAQTIKFMKDNGIDSPARAAKTHDALAAQLPTFEVEDTVTGVPMRRPR